MKKLLLLALLALLARPAFCQLEPVTLVNLFFSDYARDGAENALQRLYASNPAPQHLAAEMAQQLAELRQLTPENVGSFRDYKFLTSRSADQQPVRFTFTFYRATDRWGLYSLRIDRNVVTELQETLKLNYPGHEQLLRQP